MSTWMQLTIGLIAAVAVLAALADRGQRIAWTAIRRSRLRAPESSAARTDAPVLDPTPRPAAIAHELHENG